MWRCGIKRLLAGVVISILLSTSVHGQEQGDLKLKSEKTARILSYIPLNSPALFYVKRPARGVGYTMLEVPGLVMFSLGMGGIIVGGHSASNAPDAGEGMFGHMDDRQIGAIIAGVGFLMWFPPWLHTVIKTPDYVQECNDNTRRKANAVSFAPIMGVKDGGQVYGANLQYKF